MSSKTTTGPTMADVLIGFLTTYFQTTTEIVERAYTAGGWQFTNAQVIAALREARHDGLVEVEKRGASWTWKRVEQVPVRVSAAEIMPDGSRVPIGEPRETTISRDALDELDREAGAVECADGPACDIHGTTDKAEPLAAYITAVEQAVEAMRKRYDMPAALTAPATPITTRELDHRLRGHPVDNLRDLSDIVQHRLVQRAKYDALKAMLDTIAGWVEGAESNHEALSHRDGFEHCCGQFHPVDIRRMVADAARAVNVVSPYRESDEAEGGAE